MPASSTEKWLRWPKRIGVRAVPPFDSAFLLTLHVDHTAVNTDCNGFELALYDEFAKDLEVDFSQPVGGFIAEISQKARDRLWPKS